MTSEPTAELRAIRERTVLDHFADEVRQDWDATLSTFPHPRYELIPMGVVHDGGPAVRAYYHHTRVAFPDQHHEMIQLRHSDDAVICEFYLIGTHTGPYGTIPPTGNPFKVRMTAFFVFDGPTLTCERIYFDQLTMLRQLFGALNFRRPATWLYLIKALRAVPASLGARGRRGDEARPIG
ncbi:ester cyclase [Jidongwangia harbinensis]|uniref:ester cyclase n=1 Tax=Jidongwangia harbinensis TaxID=2878561 RepID=UPI001CDA5496|nr:ester cyclase [Jidongwangia harbinensis]MCA2214975.1 ester cyclase [Jidongwangia harbinensis]